VAESRHPPGLLAVDAAVGRLIATARLRQPAVESLPLAAAAGRVLAADVVAAMDVPPEANSAMDGYAFRHAGLAPGAVLPVSQRIAAGQAPLPLQEGTAARIFTGAILPAGADTVVMQEQCEARDAQVRLLEIPAPGANVRAAGQDVARGSVLLAAGTRLSPPALGVLASTGVASVAVFRPLRVAVLSTGDELLEPGEPWRSGTIYNSNRPLLAALLAGWGCEVIACAHVADSVSATQAAFDNVLAAGVDVIVSSGGVSVGEEDHVKTVLAARGRLDFWKIAIKPGKPVAVGELDGVPFLGLPGNPQSVFVTALMLLRPFLLARQGQREVLPPVFAVPAGFTQQAGTRREYLRVRLDATAGGALLQRHPQQSSGALSSAVWADGLAMVEPGQSVQAGKPLSFLPFSTLYRS
jgi:molybdopterin molybdotransferase